MQRACGITVWRIAPLTMARRAHDLRRALDANANVTRMRNRHAQSCSRVCARVYARTWRRITGVSGATAGMQRLCGAYTVAVGVMARELVVACSACARTL